MDAVLKTKVQAPIEYGIKIGRNSDGTFSHSNLVEGTATSTPLHNATLPSGIYIAVTLSIIRGSQYIPFLGG